MMRITNKELHELNMPQVIIEDMEYEDKWPENTSKMNEQTLESMYRVQDSIYNLFGKCEMRETQANTINPAQQNIFIPLKTWIINLGGCFAEIRIQQRALDGCFAEIKII
jgi:hypothetical protein